MTAGVAGIMDTDILPNHFYDPAKAKIYANLRWLFAKAYGPGECGAELLGCSWLQPETLQKDQSAEDVKAAWMK